MQTWGRCRRGSGVDIRVCCDLQLILETDSRTGTAENRAERMAEGVKGSCLPAAGISSGNR